MKGFMFQGLAELRTARARTALIVVTIGMITVLVTFLSSLAAGLSHQSVSALEHQISDGHGVVVNGESLSTSRLTPDQTSEIEAAGGTVVFAARTPTAMFISGEGPADLYLEHQPVHWANTEEVQNMPGAASYGLVPADYPGAITGKDALNLSGSYKAEQASLSLMINLLYIISALVLGAFFAVWTIQLLRSVAITAALGGSRGVIVTDALGQALVVLTVGIAAGALITFVAGSIIPAIPIVLSAKTLALPAALLLIAGLIGAALSIRPVFTINPRSALQS